MEQQVGKDKWDRIRFTAKQIGRFHRVMLKRMFEAGMLHPDTYKQILRDQEVYGAYLGPFQVLEHVADPWLAVREIRRVLKPGGVALMTSPFMWPWHGSMRYADFWRFTADGWRVLCRDFATVRVFPQEFHPDAPLPDLMAIEKMGIMSSGRPATGYAVKATK